VQSNPHRTALSVAGPLERVSRGAQPRVSGRCMTPLISPALAEVVRTLREAAFLLDSGKSGGWNAAVASRAGWTACGQFEGGAADVHIEPLLGLKRVTPAGASGGRQGGNGTSPPPL